MGWRIVLFEQVIISSSIHGHKSSCSGVLSKVPLYPFRKANNKRILSCFLHWIYDNFRWQNLKKRSEILHLEKAHNSLFGRSPRSDIQEIRFCDRQSWGKQSSRANHWNVVSERSLGARHTVRTVRGFMSHKMEICHMKPFMCRTPDFLQ